MNGTLAIMLLASLAVTIVLVHQDGKRIGREYGYNEARARMRHPSNQTNVRVRQRP